MVGGVTCPQSHNKQMGEQGLEPNLPPEPELTTTMQRHVNPPGCLGWAS